MGSCLIKKQKNEKINQINSEKENKPENMGEEVFTHGVTPGQLKRIRELEKENRFLKELIIDKELESKLNILMLHQN